MTIQQAATFISKIGIAKETVPGTPEVLPTVYDYTDEMSINAVQTMEKMTVIQNRSGICSTKSKYHVSGSIGIFGTPEGFLGHFLHGVLGSSVTVQQGATTAYLSTFSAEDVLDTYTIWQLAGDVMQTHVPYSVFNILTLTQTETEPLKAAVDMLGQKNEIVSTFGTPSYSGVCPFNHMELSIDASAKLQTSAVALTIANNISPDSARTVNDIFYSAIVCGKRDISGTITLNFADDDEYQKFLGSSTATSPQDTTDDVALEMTWEHSQLAGVGYPYMLTVKLPRVKYTLSDLDLSGEVIRQNITFEALYDDVAGYDVEVELTNQNASGY